MKNNQFIQARTLLWRAGRLFVFLFLVQPKLFAQSLPVALLASDTFQVYSPYFMGLPMLINRDTLLYTSAPRIMSDNVPNKIVDSAYIKKFAYRWILYYDFYTTLTGIHYINSEEKTEVNNLNFYYNVDIKSNLKFRGVKWDLYFFNDYGVRHFFDSITTKTQDQFTLKNSLYYPIYKKKLYVSLTANTKTKLFNTYQYRTNKQGEQEKYLYDGFMSPGVIMYSGGITFEAGGNSIINLGLGSSKVTKIKNQEIFETRKTEKINGLEKGEQKKSDIGLTLTSTVPLQHLNKNFHWEFYGNVFTPLKTIKDLKSYTLDVNHVFHILLLKYVRLSWRTKVGYVLEQNPKIVIQNQISLGFYLSNHL